MLIACLRRVDGGDPVDSVLRDYPEDADWLREHLLVSDALQMAGGPSAEKKARARQSLLTGVAHWDPPPVSLRPRLGLAMTHVALIVVGCLALTTAGAAAAGPQVNLRSVAEDVFETLIEPLPLPDEPQEDSVRFEPEDGAAGIGRPAEQSGDDGLDDDEASAVSDSSDDGKPTTQDGLSTEMNPPGSDLPANEDTPLQPTPVTPAATPGPEGSPPPTPAPKPTPTPAPPTDPPRGGSPGNGGHPPGNPPWTGNDGHPPAGDPPDGENRGRHPGDQLEAAGQLVQNPGPNGDGSNSSNGDRSNGQNASPNDQNNGGSTGAKPKAAGPAGKGGSA